MDNKLIARDSKLIFSLFAPERYDLNQHDGYNIKVLKDHYRSIKIIKSRYGQSNIKCPLYFDGATGRFEELPKLDDRKLQQIYKDVKARNGN